MTDAELREQFPEIAWDEPVEITVLGGLKGWACRYCIAHAGLAAQDIRNGTTLGFFEFATGALVHLIEQHDRPLSN